MDKQSVMYTAGALALILVLALVVKPLATGQPLNTGLPVHQTPQPLTTAPTPAPMTPVPTPSTPRPTAVPTWDQRVIAVEFVDPSTYGISFDGTLPNGTRFDPNPLNTSMATYARISGTTSGTTRVLQMPFPYWDLVYTVDPVARTEPGSLTVIPSDGGAPHSGVQGSYSGVMPEFTVQVVDAADPNRVVRTFSPPGGIDAGIWKTADPRPWTEKFYEGQKNYYLVITAHLIRSYMIEIRVPTKYIGKY